MTTKILMAGVLAMSFALAGNAYAAGPNGNNGAGNQVQQQTQTANQGEDTQIKTQNSEQVQSGDAENKEETNAGKQIETQAPQKSQGESETDNQVKNSEQEGEQGKNKSGSAVAEQRRSSVANAVQEMLQVADRTGGIGQQVRIIAQAQNQNQEKLEASLEKIQKRNRFVKFFAGPDYGEIDNAKKSLEQNREQIEQLKQIKNQLSNQDDQQKLTEQVQLLEQASQEIEGLLNASRKGFSLFGWMFRLFSK